MHFNEYPLSRDLFNVDEDEVKGNKFKNWKENANYTVRTTVVIQIDTTNVTPAEYAIAPNLTMITTNQALINIFRLWHRNGISFSEFQTYYALREAALDRYVETLVNRLNTARQTQKKFGEWYINYALNDREIIVHETE